MLAVTNGMHFLEFKVFAYKIVNAILLYQQRTENVIKLRSDMLYIRLIFCNLKQLTTHLVLSKPLMFV